MPPTSSEAIQRARILIADDDLDNARIVEDGLKLDHHQTKIVAEGEAALHVVRSWMPHVVLLDINMPKLNGLEVLKKVRSLSGGDYIGAIFVTGVSALDQIVAGLDAGADDYIVKPYRVDELRARVRACLRVKGLHDSLRRANRKLEDAACLDDLTSLRNMRFAMKLFLEKVEAARGGKTPFSCFLLDMDNFRMLNNKYDHGVASHVLREVAQIVIPLLRPVDLAARYGGDEIFVAMPGVPLADAVETAERIRKSIEAHVFKVGDHSIRVTGSLGVAGTPPGNDGTLPVDARELMHSADGALYVAKSGGRNRTESIAVTAPRREKP